jgi:membrane protein implicated in regulation of membrane protease activity
MEKVKSEHVRDITNTIFAIMWHISFFLVGINAVLWKWDIVIFSVVVFVLSTVFLYFNWYKCLSDEEDTDYEEDAGDMDLVLQEN